MKLSATGVTTAGANERVYGVLTNDPVALKGASIQTEGVVLVKAGAAIARGDYLKSDATGRAVPAAGEAAGTLVEVFAIARTACANADEFVEALLTRVVINRAVS
jgi:hypothetical protein